MSGTIDKRLAELGVVLPQPAPAQANYAPWTLSGRLLYVAGQGAFWDGELQYNGRLGETLTVEEGTACARIVGLNILAQAKAALDGDLDRVARCVKLGGFVNCTPDFTDQPKVINGASDLMVELFGDAGKHARFAVGAPSLPLGISVEIDAIFEVR